MEFGKPTMRSSVRLFGGGVRSSTVWLWSRNFKLHYSNRIINNFENLQTWGDKYSQCLQYCYVLSIHSSLHFFVLFWSESKFSNFCLTSWLCDFNFPKNKSSLDSKTTAVMSQRLWSRFLKCDTLPSSALCPAALYFIQDVINASVLSLAHPCPSPSRPLRHPLLRLSSAVWQSLCLRHPPHVRQRRQAGRLHPLQLHEGDFVQRAGSRRPSRWVGGH